MDFANIFFLQYMHKCMVFKDELMVWDFTQYHLQVQYF